MADANDELLELVKNSLRVDGEDDDSMLKKMIAAAKSNITGQIGSDIDGFYTENDEFDWAVVLLVTNWYINRSATTGAQSFATPLAFEDLILSLKESYLLVKNKAEVNSDGS